MAAADEDLKKNRCVGLFHAFVYFSLTESTTGQLKPFMAWVKGNHPAAMGTMDADALKDIFERVHTAGKRTKFISMQFGRNTDATFKTIKKIVEQINKDCRPKIKIEPLRIDKLIKGPLLHHYGRDPDRNRKLRTAYRRSNPWQQERLPRGWLFDGPEPRPTSEARKLRADRARERQGQRRERRWV